MDAGQHHRPVAAPVTGGGWGIRPPLGLKWRARGPRQEPHEQVHLAGALIDPVPGPTGQSMVAEDQAPRCIYDRRTGDSRAAVLVRAGSAQRREPLVIDGHERSRPVCENRRSHCIHHHNLDGEAAWDRVRNSQPPS